MTASLAVAGVGFCFGLAALLLVPAQIGRGYESIADVQSPAFFPILLAGLLMAISVGVALAALRRGGAPSSDAALEREHAAADMRPIEAPRRVLAVAACLLGYAVALPWLGMLLASGLAVFATGAALGCRRWVALIVVAVAAPLIIHGLFERLLFVLLPRGSLFS